MRCEDRVLAEFTLRALRAEPPEARFEKEGRALRLELVEDCLLGGWSPAAYGCGRKTAGRGSVGGVGRWGIF